MQKLWQLWKAHEEGLRYLIFGAMATLLNFLLFNLFLALFGESFAAGIGNVLNNAICILFAYWTNRNFVFRSKSRGAAARTEFLEFVSARLFTAVLDQLILWLGVSVLGARMFAGPGAPALLTPALWANLVKLFSQVVIIVTNFVLSKLIIFKPRH